jgi:hypothetical protein
MSNNLCFFGLWIAVEEPFPTRRELKAKCVMILRSPTEVEEPFPTRRELKVLKTTADR